MKNCFEIVIIMVLGFVGCSYEAPQQLKKEPVKIEVTAKEAEAIIVALEKERPHVPLERAVMAIRFSEQLFGTQFHPEADAQGMSMYLQREDKKQTVIQNHGLPKWTSMIEHLNDPDKINLTNKQVLPNFLIQSIKEILNPFSLS